MIIRLINVKNKLIPSGIILENGDNDRLTERLLSSIPSVPLSWNYTNDNDTLRLDVPDGTAVPDLSAFGEVVVDASTTG
jgi:hypothetical protein